MQAVDIDRLELDVPYALYVGNLAPNKAPEVLVRSLEILSSKGNPLNVYHIGRDEKDLLSHAARRSSLTRPVRSIGQLSDSALARAYSRATCLIVTSTHEGFCLPVLEAQSFGTPVICSDIPVLREIAGDGALFFSSGDPFGLARCLEVIFANVELRRRVGAAAKTMQSAFPGPRQPRRWRHSTQNRSSNDSDDALADDRVCPIRSSIAVCGHRHLCRRVRRHRQLPRHRHTSPHSVTAQLRGRRCCRTCDQMRSSPTAAETDFPLVNDPNAGHTSSPSPAVSVANFPASAWTERRE